MNPANHDSPRRRAFSLIEVLIAILVLALGLLGLGAVFPVVISQQRAAIDSTQGEVVASTAEAILRGDNEIIDLKYLTGNAAFGKRQQAGVAGYRYEWAAAWPQTQGLPVSDYLRWPGVPTYNLFSGSIELQDIPGVSGNTQTSDPTWVRTIPLSARLYPQPYSGVEPKFVWDFVARREPTQDAVQIAVFVRRIDARIRPPKDKTLSYALTSTDPNYPLMPVAIGTNGRPTPARPGSPVVYSMPQFLDVYVEDDKLDRFFFDDTTGAVDISREFARKIGQKLLDNTGVVRTVIGVDKDDVNIVIVDPPFRLENSVDDPGDAQNLSEQSKRASLVRQIVFTPETPAAVRVFTVGDDS